MIKKTHKAIAIMLLTGLFLPVLPCLVQGDSGLEQPKTIEEAKGLGFKILQGLPGAVKRVWQEEVLPVWQKMWEWFKKQFKKIWHWFLGLLGKEVERVRPEIEEKVEETKQSLWQRFKGLFR